MNKENRASANDCAGEENRAGANDCAGEENRAGANVSPGEENCAHDCSSCGVDCPSRNQPQSFLEEPHRLSRIGKVIGVVSGKGGVGKSFVAALLASSLRRRGYHTGVLDADVTGPSIPKLFGITEKAKGNEDGLFPVKSGGGVDIMSTNLLLGSDTDPVIWRGPIIAGMVKQFWTDVIWENEDFLFVDMPPGTGDVPLTVFQSLPVNGIVIVTSPQELVSMIVTKAVRMAEMMNIPILGVIENMSYFVCPDCGKELKVFGDSHIEEIAVGHGIRVIGRVPIDPAIAEKCDQGRIEEIDGDWLDPALAVLECTI